MKDNDSAVSKRRGPLGYLVVAAQGMAMGIANIIPGVSGGTMAFIMGIYEELIESIHKFIEPETFKLILGFKFKRLFDELPWRFLAALACGVGIVTLALAKLMLWLLEYYPAQIWGFFFGLVAASIISIFAKIRRWGPMPVIGLIGGSAAAFLLVGMVPKETPDSWWFFMLSGAIAICAMILPGISGSFLLVLMGKYHQILGAVDSIRTHHFNISECGNEVAVLFWVMLGMVVGMASFVQLLSWLFKRWHDFTVAVLIGFMIGSLRKIWPWKEVLEKYTDRHGVEKPLVEANILPPEYGGAFWVTVVLAVLGFAAVFALDRYAANGKDVPNAS